MKTRLVFWFIYFALLIGAALGSGCSIIPAPWTRDRAAGLHKAETKEGLARDAVLYRAQVETAVAAVALRSAPPSRPVEIATDATASAESLQAAALGPLPEKTRQQTAQTVAALQSTDEHTRQAAEESRADTADDNAKAAARLATAEATTATATAKLAAAYAEERRLAGLVRRLVWGLIGLGILAALATAFSLYAKAAFGGVGAALHAAGAPVQVVSAIDGELSKFGQFMIRAGRKAAAARGIVNA